MCSSFPERALSTALRVVALLLILMGAGASAAPQRQLRVCADPNNLPFSNESREGFENRIVDIIARELDATVTYVWWAQRRGFIRNTLKAGLCDLVPGIPMAVDMLRPTSPYYRSTYVFITREDGPDIRSLDDPRLRTLRIGVQLIGDDGANAPPVQSLARRGVVGNLQGFPVYGDYSRPDPSSPIIDAVAKGDVDVAIAWGPVAGYFAARQRVGLKLKPVLPMVDLPFNPMIFDISMGVRHEDRELRNAVNQALRQHRTEIEAILAEYGVPRIDGAETAGAR